MLGVVGGLVKDGVHLLVKTKDGDVGGRGELLRARRLGGQLLVTNVLCLLWRTVCHVGEASAQSRSNTETDVGGGESTQGLAQTLVADGPTVLAVVRSAENAATGVEVLTERELL